MKKILLAISLLGLVLVESNTNAFWHRRYNTPADNPDCCVPREETINRNGCCIKRCCRGSLVGRPRWSCCRTLRCCRPKNVCCPRYKCCRPRRSCCPAPVPSCEPTGCVTTPQTTCVEDPLGTSSYTGYTTGGNYAGEGCTTCVEDPAGTTTYSTSYGEPTYNGYQSEIVE